MSKRPAYLKNKNSSYWVISALLAVLIWVMFGYTTSEIELKSLVDNSEFKGRTFQGRVQEIAVPKSKISAYFMKEETAPLVAVSFVFDKSGSAYDSEDKQGVAVLAAATLSQGAGKISADRLRDEMALKGIKIAFEAQKDVFSGIIAAPKQNIDQAAEFLRLMFAYPRFERKYVESSKAQMLQSLAAEKENPQKELWLEFDKKIYKQHPYGRNPLGNSSTIENISREDLRSFVKERLAKNNLYIGVAGDLTEEQVADVIEKMFGVLAAENNLLPLENVAMDWQQNELEIQRDGGQNIAAFVMPGTCRKCDDFYPLYMANYLFGGAGLNSKLNQQIREKEGLTYGAYSALAIYDKVDLMIAGFSASKEKYAKAKKMFAELRDKIAKEGFNDDDLVAAKEYLTASYNLRFASTAEIAEMLAYMQKYDLGIDFLQKRNEYVENVSLQQINNAAKKYFGAGMLTAEIGIFDEGGN